MSLTKSTWTAWLFVRGAPLQGRPMVLSYNANRIDVFAMGISNRLLHASFEKKWLPSEDLGGKLKSVPSCVALKTDLHCFGIGPDSYLYRISNVNKTWSKWVRSSGPFQDTPSCVVTNTKEVSCYVQDFHREIIEIVYVLWVFCHNSFFLDPLVYRWVMTKHCPRPSISIGKKILQSGNILPTFSNVFVHAVWDKILSQICCHVRHQTEIRNLWWEVPIVPPIRAFWFLMNRWRNVGAYTTGCPRWSYGGKEVVARHSHTASKGTLRNVFAP